MAQKFWLREKKNAFNHTPESETIDIGSTNTYRNIICS